MKNEPQYWIEHQDGEEIPHLILGETYNWWITESRMVCKGHDSQDGYEIERNRVGEKLSIGHMASKIGSDGREFAEALYLAREIYGVGSLERNTEVVIPLNHLREKIDSGNDLSWKELLQRHDSEIDIAPTAIILVDHESAKYVWERLGHLGHIAATSGNLVSHIPYPEISLRLDLISLAALVSGREELQTRERSEMRGLVEALCRHRTLPISICLMHETRSNILRKHAQEDFAAWEERYASGRIDKGLNT